MFPFIQIKFGLAFLFALAAIADASEPAPAARQSTVAPSAPSPPLNPQILRATLDHFRIDGPQEWSDFPRAAQATHFELTFEAAANTTEYVLRWRQEDLKQTWTATLNGKPLGRLIRDENPIIKYTPLPPGSLRSGKNTLRIEQSGKTPDDILLGQIWLYDQPLAQVLGESTVRVEVREAGSGKALPSRITIVQLDPEKTNKPTPPALIQTSAESNATLAVRPGVIYTADGNAEFGLPAGRYQIFAGRGIEYSLAQTTVELVPGGKTTCQLSIERQVATENYAACDTHVHTLTHSGHGDATVAERMITLAGEGIELPIATDHNVHINHDELARKLGVRQFFTPVVGNEVTTRIGHFNVFPTTTRAAPPDHRLKDWGSIFDSIYRTPGIRVAILNHARDLHGGTRPFGPALYNEAIGENIEGWPMRFNGMEVINSGATQTDAKQLLLDWMMLLNRGYQVTPVGSSDSHDVARHFVGQGRTYIRCDDRDPGAINVQSAVDNFLAGRVIVSYGLIVDVKVDEKYQPGDMAPATGDTIVVSAEVQSPDWTHAETVQLFANGQLIRESLAKEVTKVRWEVPRPPHDQHWEVVALGPGVEGLYWKSAKAYQPTSPDWRAQVFSASGAIWIDGDGDGRKSSAYEYAVKLLANSQGDLAKLLEELQPYDAAVAAQAGAIYHTSVGSLLDDEKQQLWTKSAKATQTGFRRYLTAWRECEQARSR